MKQQSRTLLAKARVPSPPESEIAMYEKRRLLLNEKYGNVAFAGKSDSIYKWLVLTINLQILQNKHHLHSDGQASLKKKSILEYVHERHIPHIDRSFRFTYLSFFFEKNTWLDFHFVCIIVPFQRDFSISIFSISSKNFKSMLKIQ